MIIVLDGPSGSGKSTLAQRLSKELSIPYFDTGAMYRSFCWFLLDQKVSTDDQPAIKSFLSKMEFEIQNREGTLHYFVNGKDITKEIRSEEVSKLTSKISAYPDVREHLVKIQRKFGESQEGIFEGRDMGTVVFPNADVKFYLYADPNIRAMRRFEQLKKSFPSKIYNKEEVLQQLLKRDQHDSTREHSPLRQAEDAIVIDVSYLTLDEVFEKIKSHVEKVS